MSQGILDIRQGHVAKDVSGRCVHEEKPNIGNGFKLQRRDNSKSVVQEEQRVECECRQEEPSVQEDEMADIWGECTQQRRKI